MIKTKNFKLIGRGRYACVYRLSQRRVIKVFHSKYSEKKIDEIIRDERRGTKHNGSLPILKIVEVFSAGRKTKGLIKRYIPNECTGYEQMYRLMKRQRMREHIDDDPVNCRIDSRGILWRVDTQYKFPVSYWKKQ